MSEGYLYQRGTTWWARISVDGQRYRRSLFTSDLKEARRRLPKFVAEIYDLGTDGQPHRSWKEAVVRYVQEVAHGSISDSTLERYQVSWRQVAWKFEPLMLREINQRVISDLVSYRKTRDKASNATIRRDLTAISAVLGAAVVWQWNDSNPASDFNRKIVPERRDPISLPSWTSIVRLIQRCQSSLGRLVFVLYCEGLRLQEAADLTWQQVSLIRSELLIARHKTARRTRRPKVVPLWNPKGTIEGTVRHPDSDWVFWHADGRPYLNLSSRLAQLTASIGEEFRIHDLRHRHAVDWLRANQNRIYDLQQRLGHSNVRTTEIYLSFVGTLGGLDDDWPSAVPLYQMNYEDVIALDIAGPKKHKKRTEGHSGGTKGHTTGTNDTGLPAPTPPERGRKSSNSP